MIDLERLKEALDAYKRDFAHHWKNERYKWEAVKHFQEHWDINAPDFAGMFYAATAKTGNLLASARFFPRGMIRDFAVADPEATRAMFIRLYDETRDLVERVENFLAEADAMRRKYGEGVWKIIFKISMPSAPICGFAIRTGTIFTNTQNAALWRKAFAAISSRGGEMPRIWPARFGSTMKSAPIWRRIGNCSRCSGPR